MQPGQAQMVILLFPGQLRYDHKRHSNWKTKKSMKKVGTE